MPFVDINVVIEEVARIEYEDSEVTAVSKDILFRDDYYPDVDFFPTSDLLPEFQATVNRQFLDSVPNVSFAPVVVVEKTTVTLPGWPSLSYIDIESMRLTPIGVSLYGQASR